MEMDLLKYVVKFNQDGEPTVEKEFTGDKEIRVLFKPEMVEDISSRTKEGLKLESAYRVLKDYKGIETSEEYLELFVERFLEGPQKTPVGEILPAEIEHWLDIELVTSTDPFTGQMNTLELN